MCIGLFVCAAFRELIKLICLYGAIESSGYRVTPLKQSESGPFNLQGADITPWAGVWRERREAAFYWYGFLSRATRGGVCCAQARVRPIAEAAMLTGDDTRVLGWENVFGIVCVSVALDPRVLSCLYRFCSRHAILRKQWQDRCETLPDEVMEVWIAALSASGAVL